MPHTGRPRKYRGERYWEKEQPRIVKTDKVRVCFYSIARKLQISGAWKDRATGKISFGRAVVLDKAVVGSTSEAPALLEEFVKAARQSLGTIREPLPA